MHVSRPMFPCSILMSLLISSVTADEPDFIRDIQPILAEHCLLCHGPDAGERQGGLRLDDPHAAARGGDSGEPAIVPGRPDDSELIRRILADDPDLRMPPADAQKPLSDRQRHLLRQWIKGGAGWETHWSLTPPHRPPILESIPDDQNPVDVLFEAQRQRLNLPTPSEASSEVLCRRLYLDLIGLPPTVEQVDRFVSRANSNVAAAVADLADELLASEQFGVRWARHWLDLARYADSHGFQRDDLRDLWPYRDWVVNALNSDMPFDQFTIEQLAGDLLPDATEQQHIATGFNRCTTCNVEAGTEPEENRVNQVLDRVNTVGTVWLGLTLECAQCHDHKFDPITMEDYYRLYAFFNSTEIEAERSSASNPGSIRFLGPYRDLSDQLADPETLELQQQLAAVDAEITARRNELPDEAVAWEERLRLRSEATAEQHLLTISDFVSQEGSGIERLDDGSVLLFDDNTPGTDTYTITASTELSGITAIRLEALTDPSLPGMGPGRGDATRPNFVLNAFEVFAAAVENTGRGVRVPFRRATASFSQANYSVDNLLKTAAPQKNSGWAINPQFHKSHWALLECTTPVKHPGGTRFTFRLVQNFGGGRTIGRLKLWAVTGDPAADLIPADILQILSQAVAERGMAEQQRLEKYQADTDPESLRLKQQRASLQKKLDDRPPLRSLTMVELDAPRRSHLLLRGVYTNPGDEVSPGTPVVLHVPKEPPRNRLDLARWLTDRANPLTARVVVNRWWAELFGEGLVTTPEDFGAKGARPVWPEMLDFLAIDLMHNNWSMKQLLRTLVTSDMYRRSSRRPQADHAAAAVDAVRFRVRFRMDAEMIRDNALAIAGILNRDLGGVPIRPPQPAGLWDKVGGEKYDYVVSPGTEQYRRGLFVVLKRGSPYPSFVNFDAGARMSCVVRRSRSNTPLQALTLLNDPVFVDAAEQFARRIVTEAPGNSDRDRMVWAFRTAVARPPRDAELSLLMSLFLAEQDSVGEDAAWRAVATALLNLDETITRG